MREIKYRQAIFKDGVFSHWHYWGYLPKEGYMGDSYDHFVAPIDIVQRSWDKTYEVKPSQQCTGLVDKSIITEIYEGDILKTQGIEPIYGEISWDDDGYWECLGFKGKDIKELRLEVIGNIYEEAGNGS